jgi:hypothetical protein
MTQGNASFRMGTLELIVLQLLKADPTNDYNLTLEEMARPPRGRLYAAEHDVPAASCCAAALAP